MKQRILFGTTNQAKVAIIRALLAPLPIELLTLNEVGVTLTVVEDGQTPEENAVKKARAYFQAARLPTFSLDAALTVAGFPTNQQPGTYVRRVKPDAQEANDREMLTHYSQAIRALGGETRATWDIGTAFAIADDQVFEQSYRFEARLVADPCPTLLPGAPLSSLMIDLRSGRYFAELEYAQRPDADFVRAIMEKYLTHVHPSSRGQP